MQKYNWFLLGLTLALMSLSSNCFGQLIWGVPPAQATYYKTMQIFKRGINVNITTDSLSYKWGIEIDRLEDAAQKGVHAAGWKFNSGSDKHIYIAIDFLKQNGDSSCIFIIEANGERKTVEIVKNKPELIYPIIHQLIYGIAIQMHRETIQDNMDEPEPNNNSDHLIGW